MRERCENAKVLYHWAVGKYQTVAIYLHTADVRTSWHLLFALGPWHQYCLELQTYSPPVWLKSLTMATS